MARKHYLPEWVYDMPAHFCFQPDGKLRDKVKRAVDMKVVKVVAGPTQCHVRVDIQRPYYKGVS